MATGDVYKLRVHQRLYGSEVLNILYFQERTLIGYANSSQYLADDFRTNMETTIRGRATVALQFEYIEVERIVPYGDGPATSNWAGGTGGSVTTAAEVHPASAEVVTIYTGSIGRAHRGRLFLAGGQASATVSGLWSSTQTTRTRNFINALYARYVTNEGLYGYRWGVWSRLLAGATPPFDVAAFSECTGFAIRSQVRSQRRRNVGIGR